MKKAYKKKEEKLTSEGVELRQPVAELEAPATERKKAEQALQESEQFSSSLLTNSPNPISVINPDTSVKYVNPALEKLTGFSIAEVLGRKAPYPWWTKETLNKTANDLEKAMHHGATRLEELFQKKNGERFWVEITSTPVKINGEFKYYLSNWVEITERKRMEEVITRAEQEKTAILNSMSESVAYHDTEHRIIWTNKAAAKSVGLTCEQLLGQLCYKIWPQRDKPCVGCPVTKARQTGKPQQAEITTPDGRIWLIQAYPTQDVDGSVTGIVEVKLEITEHKQAEEREQELQRELHLSSRLASIGELAAGIAHQINNPLTGVLGFSQRLLRKSTDQEVSQDLKRIYAEAERAAKVVQNLLTFARRRQPHKQYSDINEILESALELRAYELKTSNIEVITDLAPKLPEAMLDFPQIQEVFLNIILNAEQAITEANGGGKLTIKTEERKGYLRTTFTDDGPGIPAENLEKIFDPFFTTKTKRGGTGLGLSVCHGIVTEHGGRIYARSKAGKGTTFVVELPLPAH